MLYIDDINRLKLIDIIYKKNIFRQNKPTTIVLESLNHVRFFLPYLTSYNNFSFTISINNYKSHLPYNSSKNIPINIDPHKKIKIPYIKDIFGNRNVGDIIEIDEILENMKIINSFYDNTYNVGVTGFKKYPSINTIKWITDRVLDGEINSIFLLSTNLYDSNKYDKLDISFMLETEPFIDSITFVYNKIDSNDYKSISLMDIMDFYIHYSKDYVDNNTRYKELQIFHNMKNILNSSNRLIDKLWVDRETALQSIDSFKNYLINTSKNVNNDKDKFLILKSLKIYKESCNKDYNYSTIIL